jgi:hypothetical protein
MVAIQARKLSLPVRIDAESLDTPSGIMYTNNSSSGPLNDGIRPGRAGWRFRFGNSAEAS